MRRRGDRYQCLHAQNARHFSIQPSGVVAFCYFRASERFAAKLGIQSPVAQSMSATEVLSQDTGSLKRISGVDCNS